MGIAEFEDDIAKAKSGYLQTLNDTKALLTSNPNRSQVEEQITVLHTKAVAYFNLFELSIDQYSIAKFQLNQDTRNRKIEDAQVISDTIIQYWKLVKAITEKFEITCPSAHPLAYSSTQRLLKYFLPNQIQELKAKFMAENLPTNGFDSQAKFSGWEIGSKKLTFTQIGVGLLLIAVTGYLSFSNVALNGMQYFFVRLVLALGVTLVGSATLEGIIDLNWTITKSLSIKAVGWIAIFILLFYRNPPSAPEGVKPTPLEDTTTIKPK